MLRMSSWVLLHYPDPANLFYVQLVLILLRDQEYASNVMLDTTVLSDQQFKLLALKAFTVQKDHGHVQPAQLDIFASPLRLHQLHVPAVNTALLD